MAEKIIRAIYKADVSDFVRGQATMRAASSETAAQVKRTGSDMDSSMKNQARSAQQATAAQKALGAGALLMVGSMAASFAKFDAAMAGVNAALKPTAGDLDRLRDAAVSMSAGTVYSATEAAGAITALGKAGVSTDDIIGGALQGTLNLAASEMMDVGEAAEIAASAMTQFGLQGTDVGHIADLLAAGAGKAQGSARDLGMALNQSGLVAHQMGLSVEETTTALTAMASAGMTGSDAGTSLKSMLQRLVPTTKEAIKEMQRLGISAFDSGGEFIGLERFAGNLQTAMSGLTDEQRAASMQIIFGSDAVRAANVLYAQGADGIHKWSDQVNDAGYAAKTAAMMSDNLQGDLKKLKNTWEALGADKGSGVGTMLRDATQAATGFLQIVGQIPAPVLEVAAGLALLYAAGPKISAFGTAAQGAFASFKAGAGDIRSGITENLRYQQSLAAMSTGFVGLGNAAGGAGPKLSMLSKGAALAGPAMSGLKSAASGIMGIFGGPWGLALAGATTAVTLWAQHSAKAQAAKAEADAVSKARLDAFTAALRENNGVMDENARKQLAKAMADEPLLKNAEKYGLTLPAVAKALTLEGEGYKAVLKPQMDRIEANKQEIDLLGKKAFAAGQAKNSDDVNRYNAHIKGLQEENSQIEASIGWIQKARGERDATTGSIQRQAEAESALAGVDAQASDALAGKVMSLQQYAAAVAQAGPGSEIASRGIEVFDGQVKILAADAKSTKTTIESLLDAILQLGAGGRDQGAAARSLASSIRSAGDAAVAANQALRLHGAGSRQATEALEKFEDAQSSTASAALTSANAILKNGGSYAAAKAAYDKGRASIVANYMAMGYNANQAQALTNKILDTAGSFNALAASAAVAAGRKVAIITSAPGAKVTQVELEGVTYRAGVANGKKVWVNTQTNAPVTDSQLQSMLNTAVRANGATSTITTNLVTRHIEYHISENITRQGRALYNDAGPGLYTGGVYWHAGGAGYWRDDMGRLYPRTQPMVAGRSTGRTNLTGPAFGWGEDFLDKEWYLSSDPRYRAQNKRYAADAVAYYGGEVQWHAGGAGYGAWDPKTGTFISALAAAIASAQDRWVKASGEKHEVDVRLGATRAELRSREAAYEKLTAAQRKKHQDDLKKINELKAEELKLVGQQTTAQRELTAATGARNVSAGTRFVTAGTATNRSDAQLNRDAMKLRDMGYPRLAFALLEDGSDAARATARSLVTGPKANRDRAQRILDDSAKYDATRAKLLEQLDPEKVAERQREAERKRKEAEVQRKADEAKRRLDLAELAKARKHFNDALRITTRGLGGSVVHAAPTAWAYSRPAPGGHGLGGGAVVNVYPNDSSEMVVRTSQEFSRLL